MMNSDLQNSLESIIENNKKAKEEEENKQYGAGCLMFILAPVFMLLNAWYLKLSWGWIIVPLFGVNKLGYLAALGLLLFAGIFIRSNSATKDMKAYDVLIAGLSGELVTTVSVFLLWLISFGI